jgi:hypothetical protein
MGNISFNRTAHKPTATVSVLHKLMFISLQNQQRLHPTAITNIASLCLAQKGNHQNTFLKSIHGQNTKCLAGVNCHHYWQIDSETILKIKSSNFKLMTNRSVSLTNAEAPSLERLDTEDEGTMILRNFNTYLAY